jgi:hypothetical protein
MTTTLTELTLQKLKLFQFSDINLFEIDDSGTILYCRIDNQRQLKAGFAEAVGQNFFGENLFENTEELRRKFRAFVKGNVQTENFEFNFRTRNENQLARVKFLRIVELINSQSVNSTIIDIRRSGY